MVYLHLRFRRYQYLLFCLCILRLLVGLDALQLGFEDGLFIRLVGISFTSCKNECEIRQKCLFLKYNRLNKFCELYDTRHIYLGKNDPGIYMYYKALFLHDQYRFVCDGCATKQDCYINTTIKTAICITETCAIPDDKNGLTKYVNMRKVSSRVHYVCDTPPNENYTVICEGNGQWSSALFSCFCKLHAIENSEGTKWEYFNSTHVTGRHVCLPGYEIRYAKTPLCNFEKRKRTGYTVSNACCDVTTRDGLIKVFRFPASKGRNIYQVWSHSDLLINGVAWDCKYRNNTVLDGWASFNINKVKLDIIKNDAVVAFMTFDGVGSTYVDWFAGSRLMESSWSDLTSQSAPHVDIFSIEGVNDITGASSFVIADNVINKCSDNVGWLFIAKSSTPYNCSVEFPGTNPWIVYALYNKSGVFAGNDSYVGFADRMEIWVEIAERVKD